MWIVVAGVIGGLGIHLNDIDAAGHQRSLECGADDQLIQILRVALEASWVVVPHSPKEQEFCGQRLEEALACGLVWLMAPEIGVGPYWV